jgi:hypothetical protein
MKTVLISITFLVLAAGQAASQVTLEQAGASIEQFRAAQADVPAIPVPARAGFDAAADPELDTEKAALMQRLALNHGSKFGGSCYNAVWFDVLVAAGFPNDLNVPGTSAYQFAEYAKNNPEWLKAYKMKIVPTPDSIEEMPAGSVVVYDPGQKDPYGSAHRTHGHIEVIADKGGTRYGCSDACADIGGMGPLFADSASKEHVTVLIPVK